MADLAVVRQYVVTIIINLTALNYGLLIGWPSPAQALLQSTKNPALGKPLTDEMISWVASLTYIGALIGACCWPKISDTYGRKITSILIMIPFVTSWALVTFTSSRWNLYLARVIGGMANAGTAMNAPMYVAEICTPKLRDKLGTFFVSNSCFGVLLIYITGSVLSYRLFSFVNLVIAVFSLFFTFYVPESPIFYLKNNDSNSAKEVLAWLRNYDVSKNQDLISLDKDIDILKSSFLNYSKTATIKDLFIPSTRNAILIGFGLVSTIQLSGVTVILLSTVYIFQSASLPHNTPHSELLKLLDNITESLNVRSVVTSSLGAPTVSSDSSISPQLSTIIVGLIQLIGSYVSIFIVNKANRRSFLICSYSFEAIFLLLLGLFYYLKHIHFGYLSTIHLLPVISLSCYIFIYTAIACPVTFVVMSEIFPAETRNSCMGLVMIYQFLCMFVVVKIFPMMKLLLGMYGCIWCYGVSTLICVILINCFVPETKGRSFKDVVKQLT